MEREVRRLLLIRVAPPAEDSQIAGTRAISWSTRWDFPSPGRPLNSIVQPSPLRASSITSRRALSSSSRPSNSASRFWDLRADTHCRPHDRGVDRQRLALRGERLDRGGVEQRVRPLEHRIGREDLARVLRGSSLALLC